MAQTQTEQLLLSMTNKGVLICNSNKSTEFGSYVTFFGDVVDETLEFDNILSSYMDEIGRFSYWKPDYDNEQIYMDLYITLPEVSRISSVVLCGIETDYPLSNIEDVSVQVFYSNQDLIVNGSVNSIKEYEFTNGPEPIIMRNNSLDYFDNDFWFGYDKKFIDENVIHTPILRSGQVSVKSIRIRFMIDAPVSTTRPDWTKLYYIDIGHVFIGKYDTYFAEWNQDHQFLPIGSESTQTIGNSWRGVYRGEYRKFPVNFAHMEQIEALNLNRTVLGRRPTYERFFVIMYPFMIDRFYDYSILAKIEGGSVNNHSYDNFVGSVTFVETQ